eukprot:Protomagalhaensia_sp_Gyna_25__1730@NODE_1904_length_1428_cov_36_228222_g1565_i0_p1_GENE_NODE_1904_length_1428_cov_36_228222_g1565_i0NODE_1904_length_1428_cov_36_228222_g1565_i0_p1_ORF_typecomplete_len425_score76_13CCDC142/PF14923_6/0_01AP2/PF00847_20/1_1e04AP2/PF00847_20/0_088_NODE_1904_length_1428_cov_36_228222_g1565_i0721346
MQSESEVRVPRKRPPQTTEVIEKHRRQFSTADSQRSVLSRIESLRVLDHVNEDIRRACERLRELLPGQSIDLLETYTVQILLLSFKVVSESEYLGWSPKNSKLQLDKNRVLTHLPRPERVVKFADLRLSAQGYFDVTFPVAPMLKFSEYVYTRLTELNILPESPLTSSAAAAGAAEDSSSRENWKSRFNSRTAAVGGEKDRWRSSRRQASPSSSSRRSENPRRPLEAAPQSSYSRRIGDVEETGFQGLGVKRVKLQQGDHMYLATFELDDDDLSSADSAADGNELDLDRPTMSIKKVSFSASSFGSMEAAKAAADAFVFKFDRGCQTTDLETTKTKKSKPNETPTLTRPPQWNAFGHCASCSCDQPGLPLHCRTCLCQASNTKVQPRKTIRNLPDPGKSLHKPLSIQNWDAWFDRLIMTTSSSS